MYKNWTTNYGHLCIEEWLSWDYCQNTQKYEDIFKWNGLSIYRSFMSGCKPPPTHSSFLPSSSDVPRHCFIGIAEGREGGDYTNVQKIWLLTRYGRTDRDEMRRRVGKKREPCQRMDLILSEDASKYKCYHYNPKYFLVYWKYSCWFSPKHSSQSTPSTSSYYYDSSFVIEWPVIPDYRAVSISP